MNIRYTTIHASRDASRRNPTSDLKHTVDDTLNTAKEKRKSWLSFHAWIAKALPCTFSAYSFRVSDVTEMRKTRNVRICRIDITSERKSLVSISAT